MYNNYNSLDDNTLLFNILPQLDNNDLTSLCNTDKRIANLCLNDNLWQIKMQRDFPTIIPLKSSTITWRDLYILSTKEIPIYYSHNDEIHDDENDGIINLGFSLDISNYNYYLTESVNMHRYYDIKLITDDLENISLFDEDIKIDLDIYKNIKAVEIVLLYDSTDFDRDYAI